MGHVDRVIENVGRWNRAHGCKLDSPADFILNLGANGSYWAAKRRIVCEHALFKADDGITRHPGGHFSVRARLAKIRPHAVRSPARSHRLDQARTFTTSRSPNRIAEHMIDFDRVVSVDRAPGNSISRRAVGNLRNGRGLDV